MPVSRSKIAELYAVLLSPLEDDLVEVFSDRERLEELARISAPFAHPDLEITFHGAGGLALAGPFKGFEGLVQGWRDWLSSFASYRVDVDDVLERGDKIVVLVRQRGRTIHDGVEVPSSPSAAVIDVREGRVARIAFYLDRTEAAEAEGFDLP